MKSILFATTAALATTITSALGIATPAARAFEGALSPTMQTTVFQKTASETPYEATDPRYQPVESQPQFLSPALASDAKATPSAKPSLETEEEAVAQDKGRRGFRRRGFGRSRRFGRGGFGRRGFRR